MKVEFENGSTVETLELGDNKPIRGARASIPMKYFDIYEIQTKEEIDEILNKFIK